MTHLSHAEVARVVRDHTGRLTAAMVRLVGDFAVAEDRLSSTCCSTRATCPVAAAGAVQRPHRRRRVPRRAAAPPHAYRTGGGRPARPDPAAQARAAARFGHDSEIIQLQYQDRSLWDHEVIADAGRLIVRAAALRRPGRYQLQAAIVACRAEAKRWEDTDWTQIVVLYDMLLHMAPSPVTRLHRAIALRYVTGPAAALRDNGRTADAARADQALGTMLNAESERMTAQDAIVARNAAIRAATRAAEAPAERAADAMGETPEAKR